MKVEYARRALADLIQISEYYRAVADQRISTKFEARLTAVVERIAKHPGLARPVVDRPGVRVALLISFPYKVFYRVVSRDRIRVLHIRHTAREPWAR